MAEMRIRAGLVTLFALSLAMNGEQPYTFANTPGKLPKEVAKAVDEVEFRAEFKQRLVPQLTAWIDTQSKRK
jgi:hypothetical protein